jgi:hypothetical protein
VYTGVFGSPQKDGSERDARVTSVADGLLRSYMSTVQWCFAAHCIRATAKSAPLHLRVAEALPEERKGSVRGSAGPHRIFHGDFGAAEMITAVKKLMDTAAEQSQVLHAEWLTSQAATVAVGAWRCVPSSSSTLASIWNAVGMNVREGREAVLFDSCTPFGRVP